MSGLVDARTFYKDYVDAVDAYASQMSKTGRVLSDASLRLITDAHVTARKHDLSFHHDSCVCNDARDVTVLMRRAFDADERNNATQFMSDTGIFILETHLRPLLTCEQEWLRVASNVIHAAFPVVHAHSAQRVFNARFPPPPQPPLQLLSSPADPPLISRVRRTSPRKPRGRKHRVKQQMEAPQEAADS